MNDTIKVILASIGSVIMILFIAFCIGMCSPSFRNKVYDVLDVVPEQQVESDKDNLSTQINDYINQINAINLEKEELINKVAELNAVNGTQADLLLEYQNRIDELNLKVIELNNRITSISNNINGAVLEYKGVNYNIFYSVFDSNDNYCYTNHIADTLDRTERYMGDALINEITYRYLDFEEMMHKSISSNDDTSLICYDFYDITMSNQTNRFEINNGQIYHFAENTSILVDVDFDNNHMSLQDFVNQADGNAEYDFQLHFAFGLDAENKINTLTCQLVIMLV